MNLKKVARVALLIVPLIAFGSCEQWKADEKLVSSI